MNNFFLIYSIVLSFVLFSYFLNNNKETELNLFLFKLIKIITEIFLFVCVISILISFTDIFYCDSKDTISTTVNVTVTAESAKILGKSTSAAIGQIGLFTAILGAMSEGVKLLANSGLPPFQKALTVSGIGLTEAAIHVGSSHVNRMLANGQVNFTNTESTKNAFPDLFINSPLEIFNWFNFINLY